MQHDEVKTITYKIPHLDGLFPSFPAFTASRAAVLKAFHTVKSDLLNKQIRDYQILIQSKPSQLPPFTLSVIHSGWDAPGPRIFERCLSCHPEEATISKNNYPSWLQEQNLASVDQRLQEIKSGDCEVLGRDESLCRIWLDAQARGMIVVTPKRHVGGLDEMTEDEIFDLWKTVGEVTTMWLDQSSPASFKRIVLNAGTFRNIAHAHVKVYMFAEDFSNRLSRWPPRLRSVYSDLFELRRQIRKPNPKALAKRFEDDREPYHTIIVEGTFSEEDSTEIESRVMAAANGEGTIKQLKLGKDMAVVVIESSTVETAVRIVLDIHYTKIGKRNLYCKARPGQMKELKGNL
ncbi:hypothetical protein HDU97_007862 [Phlyctochytrium planicorne]|nr:hypothetical protein HDU97_007862 [Phlyctochytrium planicorne]